MPQRLILTHQRLADIPQRLSFRSLFIYNIKLTCYKFGHLWRPHQLRQIVCHASVMATAIFRVGDFFRTSFIKHRPGSRIFRRGGRGPILGGFGLQRGHFSVKMYAKTKELGPVGGGVRRARPPLDPPMKHISR